MPLYSTCKVDSTLISTQVLLAGISALFLSSTSFPTYIFSLAELICHVIHYFSSYNVFLLEQIGFLKAIFPDLSCVADIITDHSAIAKICEHNFETKTKRVKSNGAEPKSTLSWRIPSTHQELYGDSPILNSSQANTRAKFSAAQPKLLEQSKWLAAWQLPF